MTTILPIIQLALIYSDTLSGNLLSKNLTNPSKVCDNPEIAVPRVENAVEVMPMKTLMMLWKTARMDEKTAVMAPTIEEIKLSIELIREGMVAVVCLEFIRKLVWT
jgi:hypothetical protein